MPRMTAKPFTEKSDPRLEKVAGFGRSIAQPPISLPVGEHNGHRASSGSIERAKPVLRRKYYQQRINAILRRGGTPARDLLDLAARPPRRGK